MFKNAWTIGIGILLSRLLGFVRDILIGAYLGTSELAQAFFVAFKLPNLLRDIAAEGAASSSFIPVLTQYKSQNTEEYYSLVGSLYSTMSLILLGISTIGVLFSPVLVSIIAPGFLQSPNLFHTTVSLARVLFPFLFFIGIFSINMSVLHTEGRFLTTALGQPVFNASVIISLLFITPFTLPVNAICIGIWIGAILQITLQFVSLVNLGYRPNIVKLHIHPGIKEMLKLFVPRIFGTVIYHINILIDTILASITSIVGSGGIAAIYYANRLMQFPLALFSISIAQAVLPHLSNRHAEGHGEGILGNDLQKAILASAFFIVPSGIFLAMCRRLIISVIFKRGAFNSYAVDITSSVLLYYAIGLIAFSVIKILVSSFYSIHDTKTPVKTAGISLIINTLLNIALMFPMKIAGLALASAIAGSVNAILLAHLLNKRIKFINRKLLLGLSKIFGSACIMGIILRYSHINKMPYGIITLVKAMGIASGGYLLGCALFKCGAISTLRTIIYSLNRRK